MGKNDTKTTTKQIPRGSVPPSVKLNHTTNKQKTIPLKNRVSQPPPSKNKNNGTTKHMKSASVPMKEMKHFTINQLTIWSNHEKDLADLKRKSSHSKNIF